MSEDLEAGRTEREAAEWLSRLNSRAVSTEELNAFYEWRREPANADAYARGEQLWHESRALGDDADIAAAVLEALQRPRLKADRGGGWPVGRRTVLAGGAAVAAATAAGAAWLLLGRTATEYRTAIGEQLAVRLDDGSLMRLNTDSAASADFSGSERSINLTRGQAFFEVAHDPDRPFRVAADGMSVVALGTRFDVSRVDAGRFRVVLVEGRIEVGLREADWRQTLSSPGEAVFSNDRGRAERARVDPDAATSWTVGRLTFRGTPLAEAVAEMNRYSRRQIVLDAPQLTQLQVDGVFETGDPDSFVSALTALFPLRARESSQERIVLTGT